VPPGKHTVIIYDPSTKKFFTQTFLVEPRMVDIELPENKETHHLKLHH
jgi:hypothetical protein